MSDQQFKNLMIWHRGLAVPAARNVGTDKFNEGKRLFPNCIATHATVRHGLRERTISRTLT